jgi:ATP-dependent Clp protease ATP-binding subunit ClpC
MLMPPRPYVTTRAREVFAIAHDLADRLGHDDVTPVHVALSLIREGHSLAAQALLLGRGVPREVLEAELEAHLPPSGAPRLPAQSRSWTPGDERMLEQATVEARELGTEHCGCEHVLLAFLRDATSAPAQVLARHGVHLDEVRAEVLHLYDRRPDTGAADEHR